MGLRDASASKKKKLMYARKRSWCMHEKKVDVCMKTKTNCIGPKLIDAKCTRLACFVSLFEEGQLRDKGIYLWGCKNGPR